MFFFKDENHINEILLDLYSKNLKETRYKIKLLRNEVCKFFHIKNDKQLDVKILLRLYYYYLKPYDEIRMKVDEYNLFLNEILANISKGFEFPFLESNSEIPNNVLNKMKIGMF